MSRQGKQSKKVNANEAIYRNNNKKKNIIVKW